MDTLVTTLTAQHLAIRGLVTQVDEAVVRRDEEAIQAALSRLHLALFSHLELEDARLYPRLAERAQERGLTNLVGVASDFRSSMGAISQSLTRFFRRHCRAAAPPSRPGGSVRPISSGGLAAVAPRKADAQAGIEVFAAEWRNVAQILVARILTEETSLYPLFSRLESPCSPRSMP